MSDFEMSRHVSDLTSERHAVYPIAGNEIRQFIVPSQLTHATLDNVVSGQLPRRILLAIVENDAENRNFTKNPFQFSHFGVKSLNAFVNVKQFPSIPYSPDF